MMTRCRCWGLSFVRLMAYARRHDIRSLPALMAATRCGTQCGSCRPYLDELLRTGRLRVGDQLIDFPVPADAPGIPDGFTPTKMDR